MFQTEDAVSGVKVSIVIAAYNAEFTLAECVASVTEQTHTNLEIIIVDDCSKDNTYRVALELQKSDERIIVDKLSQNSGPSAARNRALELASGDWVTVLDADDWYMPTRVEYLLKTALETNADLVFDNLLLVREDNTHESRTFEPFITNDNPVFGEIDLETYIRSFTRRNSLPNLGYLKPFLKTSVLTTNNLRYSTSLNIGEDSLLIMEVFSAGAKNAQLVDELLYCYRKHDASISRNMSGLDLERQANAHQLFITAQQNTLSPEARALLTQQIKSFRKRGHKRRSLEILDKQGFLSFLKHSTQSPQLRKYFFSTLVKHLKQNNKKKHLATPNPE